MAKYKMSELASAHGDALSHFFLRCLTKEMGDSIVEGYKTMSPEEIQNFEVDIDVRINGVEVDPRKYFRAYDDQYEAMIKDTVLKMIEDKKWAIMEQLNQLVESAESWKTDKEWEIPNPFLKKQEA